MADENETTKTENIPRSDNKIDNPMDKSIGFNNKDCPTDFFISFSEFISSKNFLPDTIRLKKTAGYNDVKTKNIRVCESMPFYKIYYKTHIISHPEDFFMAGLYNNISSGRMTMSDSISSDSLSINPKEKIEVDYSIFKNVKKIYAFYYRENSKKKLLEDGVIEEWQFASEDEARKAEKELNKFLEMAYFNTISFSYQKDNQLYIFHTRAMAFCGTLEGFYKEFKNRSEASDAKNR